VDEVKIQLIGGVGNQLFSYFAGAAVAGKYGRGLVLDTSRTHTRLMGHNSFITDFELPGEWIEITSQAAAGPSLRQKTRFALSRHLHRIPALHKFRKVHDFSDVLGWNPEVLSLPPRMPIRGYFQSWRYVMLAENYGYPIRPKLKSESLELTALREQASALKPISVHVRRGDYLKVPEFGVLNHAYYKQAVDLLRARGHDGPLWIFTDSPEAVEEVVEGRIIDRLSRPTEEMVLMSSCAAHVIANSTFSWWGAWLNENSPDVVAPEPWFRTGPEIQDLLPPSWITIPHQ
jgi:hypothetical protein